MPQPSRPWALPPRRVPPRTLAAQPHTPRAGRPGGPGAWAWAAAGLALAAAAAPLHATACPALTAEEALEQLNADRARGAACAAAAPVLAWHPQLAQAALRQAQWLARGGPLQHQGPGGEDLQERVQAATGHAPPFQRLAENLARGQRDLPDALAAWRRSAAHCANLFDARVSHAGLACSAGTDGRPVWVLVLGRP